MGCGIDEVLERHIPGIQAYVRKALGGQLREKVESMDVVQDAVCEFLRYGPKFHLEDEDALRALLCRIALNVIRGKHAYFAAARRKMAREQPLPSDSVIPLDAGGPSPESAAEKVTQEAWVRMGIELLGPEDREVILLREYEGLPFPAMAEVLGVSEEVAKKRFQRALPKLGTIVVQLQRGKLQSLTAAITPRPDRTPEPE